MLRFDYTFDSNEGIVQGELHIDPWQVVAISHHEDGVNDPRKGRTSVRFNVQVRPRAVLHCPAEEVLEAVQDVCPDFAWIKLHNSNNEDYIYIRTDAVKCVIESTHQSRGRFTLTVFAESSVLGPMDLNIGPGSHGRWSSRETADEVLTMLKDVRQ